MNNLGATSEEYIVHANRALSRVVSPKRSLAFRINFTIWDTTPLRPGKIFVPTSATVVRDNVSRNWEKTSAARRQLILIRAQANRINLHNYTSREDILFLILNYFGREITERNKNSAICKTERYIIREITSDTR